MNITYKKNEKLKKKKRLNRLLLVYPSVNFAHLGRLWQKNCKKAETPLFVCIGDRFWFSIN
jgi:hypothetical protein